MEECSLRSFTTVESQVVFGRPMGRLTGFTKWRSDYKIESLRNENVNLNGNVMTSSS